MADVTDIVCGMVFEEATAEELGAVVVTHAGKRHFFCCEACAEEFRADPATYLA